MKNITESFHLENFFSLSPDLLCIANINGYLEKVNPAFTQILGYSEKELLSQPFINFIHEKDIAKTVSQLKKMQGGKTTLQFENRCKTKQGSLHWFAWKAFYEIETGLFYAIARDISDRKSLEKQLLDLSRRDALTGVWNRRAFTEVCLQEIQTAYENKSPLAMIIYDIDFFKEFNDSRGHVQGDKALKTITKAIKKSLQTHSNMIARYGGDEFLVLLKQVDLQEAIGIAEKLRSTVEALKLRYSVNDQPEFVTITLGVNCIIPNKNYSVNKLIALADKALYQAKNAGRNQVLFSNLP